MIKFSNANSKISKLSKVESLKPFLTRGRKIYSFDLISGHSCPFADRCSSKVVMKDGKRMIVDGDNTEFRCFSASQEALYSNVYKLRKANYESLRDIKNVDVMAQMIESALPKDAGIVRVHVAGDFFNSIYFQAWLKVIIRSPETLFYAYTKALPIWIMFKSGIDGLNNLVLTASDGGKYDSMIKTHNLRQAIVAFSESEVENQELELDDDDSHAADPAKRDQSFALLLHGTQPKGSEASKALQAINLTKRELILV